jgi:heat shock protein HslJ
VDLDTGLTFRAGGKWEAYMGCNHMEGDYSVQGDKLTFQTYIYTLMLCEEQRMRQEMVFSRVFQDQPQVTFVLEDSTLTVTSTDGSTVMIFKVRARQ